MKYFLDTEFLEGAQKKWFEQTKPTIDLISIGIVAEDDREYYAISKDFNLKEAWNRYDEKPNMDYKPNFGGGSDGHYNPQFIREYWIRDNVLKPIFIELRAKEVEEYNIAQRRNVVLDFPTYSFCFREFKRLINKYGKTNKQIAEEIKYFVYNGLTDCTIQTVVDKNGNEKINGFPCGDNPEFYGYYSDYDWVVFCWLFGRMIDLPKGFPMYCVDLKQVIDEASAFHSVNLKTHKNYPKLNNEHNALADARWNYQLYKFLNGLN